MSSGSTASSIRTTCTTTIVCVTTATSIRCAPATGAYCFSLASNYNYTPRPPVVAVRDGRARVIVRGETIDDLLARDVGVAASTGPSFSRGTAASPHGDTE